jgi:DinB superfamily
MEGRERTPGEIDQASIRVLLKSQYHAALAMLRQAIEQCPDEVWFSDGHRNSYWQVAYHALFFAHLYLMPDEAAFRPWKGHQSEVQHPDGIAGPADPSSRLPLIPRPYTKREALEYWTICDEMVDLAVDSLDLTSPSSGFSWYKMPKLEHQIVNIRHIQHHTAQLADRLRSATDTSTRWVGGRRQPLEG